jgi:hypothetical protein
MQKLISKLKEGIRIFQLWVWQFKKGASWSYYCPNNNREKINGHWGQVFSWEEVKEIIDMGIPPSTIRRHIP